MKKHYLWLLLPLAALFPPIIPALLVVSFYLLCIWLVIFLAVSE